MLPRFLSLLGAASLILVCRNAHPPLARIQVWTFANPVNFQMPKSALVAAQDTLDGYTIVPQSWKVAVDPKRPNDTIILNGTFDQILAQAVEINNNFHADYGLDPSQFNHLRLPSTDRAASQNKYQRCNYDPDNDPPYWEPSKRHLMDNGNDPGIRGDGQAASNGQITAHICFNDEWSNACGYDVWSMISDLDRIRDLDVLEVVQGGPGTCNRVACFNRASIFLCNDVSLPYLFS